MSDVTNSGINQQVYRAHAGEGLPKQVSRTIAILGPRSVTAAGFNDRGELLMISYNDYKKSLAPWIKDFFEHEFLNNELLSESYKVMAAFIATEKAMLVPEILFNEDEAEKWLRQLYFVEKNEMVSDHFLREDKAHYTFAWPTGIRVLVGRYLSKAKVLPYAAYQFHKPAKAESLLQCSVDADHVYATLYKNRTLNWHQVFGYENAEDIAYQLKHVCKQYSVDDNTMTLQCTLANKSLTGIVAELSQFFPTLEDGNTPSNAQDWSSTIHLMQQLYSCAL